MPQKNYSYYNRKPIPHDLSVSLIPSKKSKGSLDTDNRSPLRNSPHTNLLGDTTRRTQRSNKCYENLDNWSIHYSPPACGSEFFTESAPYPRNHGSEAPHSQPSLPRASSTQNAGIEQHGVHHDHILQFEFDDQDLRQTNVPTSDHSLHQNH